MQPGEQMQKMVRRCNADAPTQELNALWRELRQRLQPWSWGHLYLCAMLCFQPNLN